MLPRDNIATTGALNTMAGSLAMVGSRPSRDAGVVKRLRQAGTMLLGTASLSKRCNFCGTGIPADWSLRGSQGMVNPSSISLGLLTFGFLQSQESMLRQY